MSKIAPQVLFIQPGVTRSGVGSSEGVRINLIIGQKSDGGPAQGFEHRRVSLLFVLAAPNRGEAACGKGEKFIEKGCFPIVPTVVVGNRDQIKTGCEQAIIRTSIATKNIWLGNWGTQLRNNALQVTYSEIEAV